MMHSTLQQLYALPYMRLCIYLIPPFGEKRFTCFQSDLTGNERHSTSADQCSGYETEQTRKTASRHTLTKIKWFQFCYEYHQLHIKQPISCKLVDRNHIFSKYLTLFTISVTIFAIFVFWQPFFWVIFSLGVPTWWKLFCYWTPNKQISLLRTCNDACKSK